MIPKPIKYTAQIIKYIRQNKFLLVFLNIMSYITIQTQILLIMPFAQPSSAVSAFIM